MKYEIDEPYTTDCFETLVNVPSPVGYYVQINPVVERLAAELGKTVTYDHKHTAYITLDGEDNSKTVMIGAHLDTIGMIVRRIDDNGYIRVRQLGGMNFYSAEGETVTVHTRGGRSYTGLLACQSHSTHVFDDARTSSRDELTMILALDEPVKTRDDVLALGIRHGDVISIEPRFQKTPNGYIKSRFIDDKAAAACCFSMIKYLNAHNLKPKYRTLLAFPHYEEIGHGGAYIPAEVSEFVAVDIGLIGPDYDGNERKVSICAKDFATPYDYDLVNRLIRQAEQAECDYAVDIFYRYGTDANASWKAGNNLQAAAFGMACYCSHGMERTHITGLSNTVNLLLAYVLDL
ncbi:MAG: M42 family metallopeptidase [Lachnospiraceae bacterium]|nr:M42 family metallopeptidase [Lachnospiraceae bacterium]